MHDFELNRTMPTGALYISMFELLIKELLILKSAKTFRTVATSFYFCEDQLQTQPYTVQIQLMLSPKLGMSKTIAVNSSISVYSKLNVCQIRPPKT